MGQNAVSIPILKGLSITSSCSHGTKIRNVHISEETAEKSRGALPRISEKIGNFAV